MKIYHNTNSEIRIEPQDFDFSKLGENTFSHASDFAQAFPSLMGVWFSGSELQRAYKFAHGYEVNDDDFRAFETLEELVDYICIKLKPYTDYLIENDLFKVCPENLGELREIASEIRDEMMQDGFTGMWVRNDEEFDAESFVCFDMSVLK